MMMLYEKFKSPLYIIIKFRAIDTLKQYNIGIHVLFIYLRIKLMSNFLPYFFCKLQSKSKYVTHHFE